MELSVVSWAATTAMTGLGVVALSGRALGLSG
jgi:hypothetical protein